jgi:hypothetical protein
VSSVLEQEQTPDMSVQKPYNYCQHQATYYGIRPMLLVEYYLNLLIRQMHQAFVLLGDTYWTNRNRMDKAICIPVLLRDKDKNMP